MKKNEGQIDRALRAVAGVLLIIAGFLTTGAISIVFWVVGAILALTAALGFCPLYQIFGINTCKLNK
ncbi:DUF2892 domain-containing protein [Corynebacterium sp. HS2168-gen11]|uniref:YgaP family membrane protein n=1 Tax=Corynebacterium sp. HS2168-gen11 TaxID=2974027 RepID=UPI00216B4CFF|nr:DUF2892 domain-containing protein [Corynebacterium sp. HS2168-gen11]MCS4536218.1 DUF2892 domain-containing protein [Corynebacterium sp. HS2168-gen11]